MRRQPIWLIYDLATDVKNRLAGGPGAQSLQVWSKDGRFIVYSELPGGMKRYPRRRQR